MSAEDELALARARAEAAELKLESIKSQLDALVKWLLHPTADFTAVFRQGGWCRMVLRQGALLGLWEELK